MAKKKDVDEILKTIPSTESEGLTKVDIDPEQETITMILAAPFTEIVGGFPFRKEPGERIIGPRWFLRKLANSGMQLRHLTDREINGVVI